MRPLDVEEVQLARAAAETAAVEKAARQAEATLRRERAAQRNLAPGGGAGGDGPARRVPPLFEGADWPSEPTAPFGNGGTPTTVHIRLATAVDVSRALASGYCSVLRRVPKQLAELWRASLELVFDLAARDSEAKQTAGYALLMLLPSLTLRFARGERGRAGSYNAMAHRLKRFLAGDWQLLLEEWWAADRAALAAEQAREPQPPGESDRRRSLVERVVGLLADGQLSRALALIEDQRGVAALTEEVILELRRLHPAPVRPVDAEALRDFTVPPGKGIRTTPELVQEQLSSAPRRSSGGPSKLSFDHLRDPVASSPPLLASLTTAVQRLLDGAVPPRVASMLADSRLIALVKPNGKARPIAIGDTVRRLAGRVLLASVANRVTGVLAPHQLGVGARGATEAILHVVNAFLRQHPNFMLLIFDYRNAFNCASRAAALEAVMADDDLCAAVPYLKLFYSEEAQLWLRATDDDGQPLSVLSREGAQQGDVLGPLLFALATLALVRRICRRAARAEGLGVYYADDGIALVPDDAGARMVRLVVKRSAELGLSVNIEKTVALKLQGEVPRRVRRLGLHCIDATTPPEERGAELLGGPVGTPEFAAAFLNAKVIEARTAVARVSELLGEEPAAAAVLLRRCVARRFLHLERCCHPSLTGAAARSFDDAILDGERELAAPGADVELSRTAKLKLALPGAEGGFGSGSAAALAPVAYIASAIAALPVASAIWPDYSGTVPLESVVKAAEAVANGDSLPFSPDLDDPSPSAPLLYAVSMLQPDTARELAAACRETLAAAAAAGSDAGGEAHADGVEPAPLHPTTPRRRRVHPAAGLQRRLALTLSRAAASKLRDDVLAADAAGRALHLAETGFCGVDAWASALPREHDRMDADTYRTSMAWSLGLPIAGFEGRTCRCGRLLTAADGLTHTLSCRDLPFLHTGKHHLLGCAFDTITEELPGAVRNLGRGRGGAPSIGTWVDAEGREHQVLPDRIISGVTGYAPATRLILDFTLANPARSSTPDAGTTKLAAVSEEHQKKLAHYRRPALGLRLSDRIVPVALDLGGGVHKTVMALLKDWAVRCAGGDDEQTAYILRGWQVRLAVALAYARARFVFDALDALTTGAAAGREREPYAHHSHPYSPRARFPTTAGRRASRLAS